MGERRWLQPVPDDQHGELERLAATLRDVAPGDMACLVKAVHPARSDVMARMVLEFCKLNGGPHLSLTEITCAILDEAARRVEDDV